MHCDRVVLCEKTARGVRAGCVLVHRAYPRALQNTSEKNETTSSYTFTYSRESALEKAGLTTEDQVVVPVRIAHVGVRVQLEKLITRDAARSVRANLMADGTWSGSGLELGLGLGSHLVAVGTVSQLRQLSTARSRAKRGELGKVEETIAVHIEAAEDRVRFVP